MIFEYFAFLDLPEDAKRSELYERAIMEAKRAAADAGHETKWHDWTTTGNPLRHDDGLWEVKVIGRKVESK